MKKALSIMKKKLFLVFVLLVLGMQLFAKTENYLYFEAHKYSSNGQVELVSKMYCSKKLLNYSTKRELEQSFNDLSSQQLGGFYYSTVLRNVTRIELEYGSYMIWFDWFNIGGYGNVSVEFLDYEHENLGWQTIFSTGDFVYDFEYCFETYQEKCKEYIKKL